MSRDWNAPVWSQAVLSGQGGYKPGETRASNVTRPINGSMAPARFTPSASRSARTAAASITWRCPAQRYVLWGQIYPMKEHRSNSARHTTTGQIIPHSTFTYFATGDYARAVQDGMAYAGLTGSYSLVTVHEYQTINHGVAPATSALACGNVTHP